MSLRFALAASLAVAAASLGLSSLADARSPGSSAQPQPDLADTAQGTYYGDVISDARGASQSDVTITVTKVGPNRIHVSSSYPRLPDFTTRVSRAMQTIQQVGTQQVFLLDLSRTPHQLDLTVDDASWSGTKRDE